MYPFIKLEHPENFNLQAAIPLHRHLWAHPEQHQQRMYGHKDEWCGTVACVAGWTVLLDPETKVEMNKSDIWINNEHWADESHGVFHAAKDILGLTQKEAAALFLNILPAFIARLRLGSMIRQARRYHKGMDKEEQARQWAIDVQAQIQLRETVWEALGQNYTEPETAEEFDAMWDEATPLK